MELFEVSRSRRIQGPPMAVESVSTFRTSSKPRRRNSRKEVLFKERVTMARWIAFTDPLTSRRWVALLRRTQDLCEYRAEEWKSRSRHRCDFFLLLLNGSGVRATLFLISPLAQQISLRLSSISTQAVVPRVRMIRNRSRKRILVRKCYLALHA